jgi:ABC-type uncharacterized transport system permease subunit
MFPTIASVLASVLYCLCAFLIFKQLGDQAQDRRQPLALALIAMLLHAVVLNQQIYQPLGLNLEFFVAFSLISWLVSVQILLSCIFRKIESLGIVVFPMTSLAIMLALVDVSEPLIISGSNALQGHIMISVIAYSLITLGAIQACLLAYQDYAIRSHNPGGMIRYLPPLHDMETLLFQFLGFGFVGLSASLISGFIFLEDIFAQHLVHKTVLSIVAWLVLVILLFGRFQFGWRGKIAIRWSLSAFALLMLAYFGSKLVLELIL